LPLTIVEVVGVRFSSQESQLPH